MKLVFMQLTKIVPGEIVPLGLAQGSSIPGIRGFCAGIRGQDTTCWLNHLFLTLSLPRHLCPQGCCSLKPLQPEEVQFGPRACDPHPPPRNSPSSLLFSSTNCPQDTPPPKPAQLPPSTFICIDRALITPGPRNPKPRIQDGSLKSLYSIKRKLPVFTCLSFQY